MVRQIVFSNEITLWWEYTLKKSAKYFNCFIDDEIYSVIKVTHITYKNLIPKTKYKIRIECNDGDVLFDNIISTKPMKNIIDVTQEPYCAVGDGITLNTTALQRAFDDCTENDYVYVPKGIYLTGALRMHSNFELELGKDCVLQGSKYKEDYLPKIKSRFEGLSFMCYSSLLNAGELDSDGDCNCYNVIIRGQGRIVGGGNELRKDIIDFENKRLKKYIEELGDKIKEFETTDTIAGRFRGRLINISNVDGFIISGVSVESSPSWNLHMVYSKNLTVYNCSFISKNISNGDGIDPDSVEDCAIFNCTFDTSDDCIAIKSGRNPEGNVVNRKTSNVYIFDCCIKDGHSFCVGSEMSGGVENVYVWDCDLTGAYIGMQFKFTKKRGGYIKNCYCYRCKLSKVCIRSAPFNDDGQSAETIPELYNFYFEDCVITGDKLEKFFCFYIFIKGIDSENLVRNVFFKNVELKCCKNIGEDIVLENVENIVLNDKLIG